MSDPATSSDAGADDRPPHERRASVRYTVQRDSFCQPGTGRADQFWRFAKMLDLSATGIRLLIGRGFEAGTALVVELSSADASFACTVEARVVHATEAPGGWLLGCTFATPLRDEDLKALL